MENIALSDSNDELTDEIVADPGASRPPPRMFAEQQHVASELQDAANTDVTRGMTVLLCTVLVSQMRLICILKLRLQRRRILRSNLCFLLQLTRH